MAWSFALAAVGLLGIWLAGSERTRRVGWGVGVAAQALWIVFAFATGQYGFLLTAVAYGSIYARNFRRA